MSAGDLLLEAFDIWATSKHEVSKEDLKTVLACLSETIYETKLTDTSQILSIPSMIDRKLPILQLSAPPDLSNLIK